MELTYIQDFLLSLAICFFDFFMLEMFTEAFFPFKHKYQFTCYRIHFFFLYILNEVLPFDSLDYTCNIIIFLYILFVSAFHWKQSILFFLKYKFFYYLLYFACAFISAFVFMGYTDIMEPSNNYTNNQVLINTSFSYILLSLYLYHKRLKKLSKKKSLSIGFICYGISSVILLQYCNRFLYENPAYYSAFSYIFLFVICVTAFNSYNYRKLIEMTEAQIQQRVLLEKYSMELSYVKDIDESLRALAKIRHDFKNHLIILEGYARTNQIDKQREYISRLNNEIKSTKLYDTSNNLISSILNAKNALCEKNNISLQVYTHFQSISIDDFSMITILGNILDNAITAAAKTQAGSIELSLVQLDSYLEIKCKNNHCEAIQEKNGILLTTKKYTSAAHGLGLGNVKACVDKLHGNYDLQYDEATFCIDILIPNYL